MYGIVDNPTYEDVWDTVLVRYWRSYWWAETFNACRIELNDNNSDPDRDWYRPFLHSACVSAENAFRGDLKWKPRPAWRV